MTEVLSIVSEEVINGAFDDVVVVTRDPYDKKLIAFLSFFSCGLLVILSLTVSLLIYKHFKKPTVITVVKQGNEVVEINDLSTDRSAMGVSMRPGDITDDEKIQIAKALARGLYRINPLTRDDDNAQLINLMEGPTAKQYWDDVKNSGLVARQASERWSANWTPVDASIVGGMPNTVRVLGRQDLSKVVGDKKIEETHTFSIEVVLVLDERGRDPRNLNTGLRVRVFSVKEIPQAKTEKN